MSDAEEQRGGIGEPDGLERLWTPHRMTYIAGENRPEGGYEKPAGCPFCHGARRCDEDESLVVARGELVYAVLNLYPYNPGHLLVCPYRHVADYTDLTEDETVEVAAFTRTAMRVIRRGEQPARLQPGDEPGLGGRRRHRRRTCISTWCRGGAATATSCR